MTIQGGNIESKTIGVPIGLNGTFINTELIDNKIQLSKDGNGLFYEEGTWTSRVIDIEDNFESFGKVFVTNDNNGTSSIAVLTRTSDDGLIFDNWTAIAMDGSILSVKRRYISVRIVFYASFGNSSIPITGIQLANTNQYVNGDDNSINLKRNYNFDMSIDNNWNEDGELYRSAITRDEWLRIDKLDVNTTDPLSNEKVYLDINNSYGVTLSENNLKANYLGSIYNKIRATKGVSEGKHYFEVDVINGGAIILGLILESVNLSIYQDVITIGNANRGIYPYNSALFPSSTSYPFGTVVGSTVSFLIDMDNGTLEFWNNGVSRGIAYSDLKIPNETLYPFFSSGNAGTNEIRVNFGGSPFKYNIPNGYTPYEKLITNKTLILHDGEYKKINPKIEDTYIKLIDKMSDYTSSMGTVSAEKEYSGRRAWNAFDESILNFNFSWQFAFPAWLRFDFNSNQNIKAYSVTCLLSETTYMSKTWTFEITKNGTTWEVVDRQFNLSWTVGEEKMFVLDKNYECIGFRINVTDSITSEYARIGEMNVYSLVSGRDSEWSTVSNTTPSSQQFLSDGMNSLSPILNRKVLTLTSLPLTDKSEILLANEVGKVFGRTIDLKKYFDIRNMKLEVR